MQIGYNGWDVVKYGVGEVVMLIIVFIVIMLVVFLLLVFWLGIMGEFFKYLFIILIIVLIFLFIVVLVINIVFISCFMKVDEWVDDFVVCKCR